MADLWNAPSFAFLKKSLGRKREFLFELLSPFEALLLGLSQLSDGTDKRRIPFQDEDLSWNKPHLLPGFPSPCSELFMKQLQIVSVTVDLGKCSLVQKEDSKFGTLSC